MSTVLRYAAFDVDGEGGNPAGVVLDARGMDDTRMQRIAAGVGYSETAFLFNDEGAGGHRFRIRYFSPRAEVAFCGHATIATAVALAEREGTGNLWSGSRSTRERTWAGQAACSSTCLLETEAGSR